jgi:signal transduction histidine kinase/DNA-binding NarL/FixJ family response regulator
MSAFTALPTAARWYVAAHVTAGAAAIATVLLAGARPASWWALAGVLLLSAALNVVKVDAWQSFLLVRVQAGLAAVALAQLTLGTVAAVLAGIVGTLAGTYANRRPGVGNERLSPVPLHRAAFNVSACALPTALAAIPYEAILASLRLPSAQEVPLALLAWATTFFVLNSVSVAAVLSLTSGRPVATLWRKEFLWAYPEALASAALALAAVLLWRYLGYWALMALPGIYVLYEAYRKREAAALRDRALEASRFKTEFLATMSHEIRTPLTGVLGMSELLLRRPLDPESRDMARMLDESARSLLAIVNDVLDLSKIEAGELRLEMADLELPALVESALRTITPAAEAKGLALRLDLDPALRIRGDGLRVRQVLLNLLSNAVKFTERGEVRVTASAGEPGKVRVTVADTGRGMAPESCARLFQPYQQADGTQGGTGLGLAICKRLVELMGGTIGVESREGAGSTFWFTLPAAEERLERELGESAEAAGGSREAPEHLNTRTPIPTTKAETAGEGRTRPEHLNTRTPEHPTPQRSTRNAQRPKVLLVDDHPINREVGKRQLELLGCIVDVATNGREAVAAVEAAEYALVFMDSRMPEMDGPDAVRAIRAAEPGAGPRTPIVGLSANILGEDREACLQAGMDGVLTKPATIDQLREAVEHFTSQKAEGGSQKPEDVPGHSALPASPSALRLEALRELLGPEPAALAGFIETFVRASCEDLERLRAALDDGNAAQLEATAHSLKGSASVAAADELARLASELEHAAGEGDLDRAAGLVETLELELQRVKGVGKASRPTPGI